MPRGRRSGRHARPRRIRSPRRSGRSARGPTSPESTTGRTPASASWYDFAVAIAEESAQRRGAAPRRQVIPIGTADYPTPAKRPRFSVLDKTATVRRARTDAAALAAEPAAGHRRNFSCVSCWSPAAPASSAAISCTTGCERIQAIASWCSMRSPMPATPRACASLRDNVGFHVRARRHLRHGLRQPAAATTHAHRHARALRGRVARRPLDSRSGCVHHDQRARHAQPAQGRAQGLAAQGRRDPALVSTTCPPTRCTARSARTIRRFSETTPYAPNSPYSASKAASDHLVRAYHHTYGLDVTTSNCSNNYGPFHFPGEADPAGDRQPAGRAARFRSMATARTSATGCT